MMRAAGRIFIALLSLECAVASAQTGSAGPALAGPFTVEAEVLVWWYKSSPTPVPVITDGLYGQPDTKVLLGGGGQNANPNTGFRLTAGYAIDARWGIDGNFFYIPRRSTSRSVASSGTAESTDLLLPFFDVTENRENVTELSFSPVYSGSATEESSNKLMGAELNATSAFATASPWNITWLGGLRWMQLEETYTVTTSSSYIPPEVPDVWNTTDRFGATNNFYGAQVGAKARYDSDRWFATGVFKLGLGAMVQSVDVDGSLATDDFTADGSIQTFSGGYFALPTNIGSRRRTVFAVLPEVQLNVGYRIAPTASIFLGYSFLYTNSVARPGDQMNRNINPTQSVSYVGEPPVSLQGPAQPTFGFNSSSFWAQGISAGLSIRF